MTQARILADYASGIGTQGATLTVDGDNRAVAIGTTNVSGIGSTTPYICCQCRLIQRQCRLSAAVEMACAQRSEGAEAAPAACAPAARTHHSPNAIA